MLADLLHDEHPRHARHRNAAEDHDHQTDHAQVVLRPIEVAADLVVVGSVGARGDVLRAEIAAQRAHERVDLLIGHPDEQHAARPAADVQEPGRGQIVVVDEHARPEAEAAHPPSRLGRDHAADGEPRLADRQSVAHLQVEGGEQLRTHEHAVVLQQRIGVGPAALEPERPVQGEARLNGPQLHHAGERAAVRGSRHRRRLDRLGPLGDAVLREAMFDGLAGLARPLAHWWTRGRRRQSAPWPPSRRRRGRSGSPTAA